MFSPFVTRHRRQSANGLLLTEMAVDSSVNIKSPASGDCQIVRDGECGQQTGVFVVQRFKDALARPLPDYQDMLKSRDVFVAIARIDGSHQEVTTEGPRQSPGSWPAWLGGLPQRQPETQ
jgi:hypothetical protein